MACCTACSCCWIKFSVLILFNFCFCWLHSFHVRYKNLSPNHFLNRFCFKVCLCLLQFLLQLLSLCLSLSRFVSVSVTLNTVAICRSISPEPTMQHYLCATVFSSKSDKVETQPELCTTHTYALLSALLFPSLSVSVSLPSLPSSSILSTSLYICGALCLCSYSLGLQGGEGGGGLGLLRFALPHRLKPEIVLGLRNFAYTQLELNRRDFAFTFAAWQTNKQTPQQQQQQQ